MFKRAQLFFFTFLGIAMAGTYWLNIRLRPEDALAYHKLVQESAELKSHHALERQPARQIREGVQKDIWIPSKGQRLHIRLKSGHSELTLRQKRGKVEAVEKLTQIDCWAQDEIDLLQSMQQVRSLTAEEGVYYFPAHHFLAQSVHLAFFHLSGTDLPFFLGSEKPFLTGTAQEVNFAVTSKLPTFTVYHLQAELDPERSLP